MRAKLAALAAGTLVVGIPLAVVAIDAAWPWRPSADRGVAARVAAAPDLDAYLTAREDSVPGVTPALRKAIHWHDPATRARTPVAVVYLHGFSASRGELAPVPERLADSLGANLFVTRLAAHGRVDGEAFATVRPQDWIDDAREALAIGHRIGNRVIVLGMSTGALLALELAAESPDSLRPAALLLGSPNYEPRDPRARFIAGPFGPTIARLVGGTHREFEATNAAHAALWTRRYRVEGIAALMDLVLAAQRLDLAGITVPVLTLYSRHDDVIRLDLVAANHARFGSPLKEIVDLPEATRHELASDALVPAAVDPAVRVMLDFSRRALAAR
jgi:alpha-beta hydrolase superfamily lysophospholipase